MIRLTRLRHNAPLYLNADLIERLEQPYETVVRLTNGTEYVVNESPEEIVALVRRSRAEVIALAALIEPTELDGAEVNDDAFGDEGSSAPEDGAS